MDLKEIESAMEGILFAAGEPVGVERICLALEIDRATADAVAQKLMDAYSYERRGIRLIKLDSSYQLCSAPEYAELIRKTFESRSRPNFLRLLWRCCLLSPTISPRRELTWTRSAAWTARIP